MTPVRSTFKQLPLHLRLAGCCLLPIRAMSETASPAPAPPSNNGQVIVHGEAGEGKPRPKKRIRLLDRTPSPVILDDYGEIDPSRCTVGGPGIAGGIVGVPTQVTVRARDSNGVGIREGGHQFTMSLQHTSTGSVARTYESTDRGDGTYTFNGVRADLKGMHKVRCACLVHQVLSSCLP